MFSDVTAPYGKRAIALMIDIGLAILIGFSLGIVGLFLLLAAGIGVLVWLVTPLVVLCFAVWNSAIRQGQTGQSIGKRQQGIAVVKADSGSVPGVGTMLLRELLFWFFNTVTGGLFLIVDYLFPVFDSNQQRIMDKMLRTRVVDRSGIGVPPPPMTSFGASSAGSYDPFA